MKIYLLVIALVLMTVLAPSSSATDSSQRHEVVSWTVLQGYWAINSTGLTGQGVSAEVVSSQTFASDRTVIFRMQTINTIGTGSTCCPYYTARANGKYVDFSNKVFMDIWTNGIINLVISTSTTYTNNGIQTSLSPFDPHTVKMVFRGDNLKISIDGVGYWNITDSRIGALGAARIALSSWGTSESSFGFPIVRNLDTHDCNADGQNSSQQTNCGDSD
ncbi:MAG TPA: hypothetical protein VGS11_03465 [Candidatus Bathyarchaeia archaeon]|nr:hypothetical protein [Candidatus Bathyarchaeia archaeon]